jgi:hypothetical protein
MNKKNDVKQPNRRPETRIPHLLGRVTRTILYGDNDDVVISVWGQLQDSVP